MLHHLKTFWKAISTGWVIEYPEPGEAPRDFFDRRDRRPMYVEPLPRYEDLYSSRRQGQFEESGREDVADRSQRQDDEDEGREDAVFRWSEQMRLKDQGRIPSQ
ncbi:hypothetical protein IFR05_005458 [Cadophora sp. M221]|nr:hypothetical protein IFR05_005458 [Cadophora sp. M221]